jgi:hypothetical protein
LWAHLVTAGPNPVELKIDLATRGARVDAALHAELAIGAGFIPRSLDLVLPHGVSVRVPIGDAAAAEAPYSLVREKGRLLVVGDGAVRIEVRERGVPRFYGQRTSGGRPMWQVGAVHGGHLLVTPTRTCGFGVRGGPCSFCREGARPPGEREGAASTAEVVEVVRAAFVEGVADYVFFNSDVYDAEDGGIGFLTPYVEAVRKHFDTFVAMQVHPPQDDAWVDRTYAMGVDALSYNLEIYDADALARHCTGRARYLGRDRYLGALAHAARIFPRGTVWCELVLGIEPAESTMAAIDALAAMGVVPVLTAHHPTADAARAVVPAELEAIVARLAGVAHDRRVATSWIRDVGLGVTPLEASRLAGATGLLDGAVRAVTGSRLGAYAARGLARFRRRLRVRAIGDSLESSHL